jgi:hypothetical protein
MYIHIYILMICYIFMYTFKYIYTFICGYMVGAIMLEMLPVLCQVYGARTVSRTYSFQYNGSDKGIP